MILIIDDDRTIRSSLAMLLRRAGREAMAVASPDEALDCVRSRPPELMLMDMNFGSAINGRDGLELLQRVRILAPEVPVILITAWGSIPLAVEGMRLGAADFMTKPLDSRMLLRRIDTIMELNRPADASAGPHDFRADFIIGRSAALQGVLDIARRISATDASVLITGENGTGKELIARAIHLNSRRAPAPLVTVNMGGIPASLFESEMFGHTKGAFTGALTRRTGRFKEADGGTIFLDEIGELDISCQVKLLRVLQQQQFEPLGQSKPEKVDVRVISATNADLGRMIGERTFREDLFYRINTISIRMPSLAERREDIPLLVRHFAAAHPEAPEFSAEAMTKLTRLPYPGNVRQLKNIVDRAILISGSARIEAADIPDPTEAAPASAASGATPSTLLDIEREAIVRALEKHAGNLTNAALELGITRQSLYRRMEKLGLKA